MMHESYLACIHQGVDLFSGSHVKEGRASGTLEDGISCEDREW
jgi:hypothetical protein